MQFMFAEKSSPLRTCTSFASRMHLFTDDNISQLNKSRYGATEFKPDVLQQIAEALCDPQGLNILMRSQSFKDTDLVSETEEWYGTKYKVTPFTDSLKEKMANPQCEIKSKKLDLPPVNNMIPTKFEVLEKDEQASAKPHILKQWDDTDLWYKKDDKFQKPKACISMKIYTTDSGFCVQDETRVFASVWNGVQEEYLREFNYMADCANLYNSVGIRHDNINFAWSGWNDSMPNYVNETMLKLKEMP